MDENIMRLTFNERIKSIVLNKREDNNAFLSTSDYCNVIEQVKKSKKCLKTFGEKKTVKDYRTVRKYDILIQNGKECLIKPMDKKNVILYYVTTDELFDILYETHCAIGHGGRNRMVIELKNKYCNITNETIMVFLKLCAHCQKKVVHPKRALVSKPVLQSTFNSRAQIDFLDMQGQHYNNYCFIMKYQDYLSKFVVLKPLKSKCAAEIASNLIEIYTIFGAPAILQSNDRKEFINSVINKLHAMWNEIKIVYDMPRYGQSEDSIEQSNIDVEEMLAAWMAENNSPDWPSALKFIQFKKNQTVLSGIYSNYIVLFNR